MTTEEGNKLIAEFHGEFDVWKPTDGIYPFPLKYNSSWDWLMPVVEKIESLDGNFIVTIEALYCVISENGENPIIECQQHETKIENVFQVVIQFIEWYNQQ